MLNDMLLVMTNFPDAASAQDMARHVIERRLAACANIVPGVQSVYRWQGTIEEAHEVALWMKTMNHRYAELENAIKAGHPYDVPEIVAVPVTGVLPSYLAWIDQETKRDVAT